MILRMPVPDLVLLLANVVYGTSYVATRLALRDVGPALLALCRLVLGSAVLLPVAVLARRERPHPLSRRDRWDVFWMGTLGFAGAFACAHWGIRHSTATTAALLITIEPVSLILLSPFFLRERLRPREAVGAALAVGGAAVVVLNGIPWVTETVVPHWRGDLLLILSGLAYASYSLFGRGVLARHPALLVTTWSILWGALTMAPLAGLEWAHGPRPRWTLEAVGGTLYLALVITALGYFAWNYALERVPAPRAAIFLNVQPLVGALLGVGWLGEPLTLFTVAGGILIVAGLSLTVKRGPP
jgi:drug/metabolite transporter (DMT)-like permease